MTATTAAIPSQRRRTRLTPEQQAAVIRITAARAAAVRREPIDLDWLAGERYYEQMNRQNGDDQ